MVCSLHFLSYHLSFSSSFPVLSLFIFSIPFVLLHSCHRFVFLRHVLFHSVSFTLLSYFTLPLHWRWSHYHFLPRFILWFTSVFQDIFCFFAPFCVSSIRMYSCYLLKFKGMYPFVFSYTPVIAFDPVFYTFIISLAGTHTSISFTFYIYHYMRFLPVTSTLFFHHFLLHVLF